MPPVSIYRLIGQIQSDNYNVNTDGETDSEGKCPQHLFEGPNTYTTSLIVVDGAGNADTTNIEVTVTDTVASMASIGADSITAPSEITITSNGPKSTDTGQLFTGLTCVR